MKKDIYVTKSSMPPYDEYICAIKPLWNSALLTNMGKFHSILEENLKNYLGVKNISLFCNGHTSLEMAIQAFGLKGEVITTPFTFISTTNAIVRSGLRPVFCDIRKDDFTINADQIESLITEKTSAIMPVHVYGNVCEVNKIQKIADKYGLKVIYDAAHAFGVKFKNQSIGNFGDASIFSFHATKVYNTIEGGAITFQDNRLEEKLNEIKNFGIYSEEVVREIGGNGKMNEFQSIMGICNLKYIDAEIKKRRKIVNRYYERLSKVEGIQLNILKEGVERNYAYFPIVCHEIETGFTRDELFKTLQRNGIHARKYFYPLTLDQVCYKEFLFDNSVPNARYISERILTLPLYADLSLEDVDYICNIILKLHETAKQNNRVYVKASGQ